MYLYKEIKQYDVNTGKEIEPRWVKENVICDLTGKIGKYQENIGQVYSIDYGGEDPCFGCLDFEYDFGKKWHIDVYSIFDDPFIFIENEGSLIKEMSKGYSYGNDRDTHYTVWHAFRYFRIQMLDKLLTEKKYTIKQLGLDIDEEYYE